MEKRIQLVQEFFNEITRCRIKDGWKFDLWDLNNVLEILATDDKDYTYLMDIASEHDAFPKLQNRLYQIVSELEEV